MATLIQSKQIEGIVTASTIEGDFSVSGSLIVSGSGIFTNDITASGVISANQFVGDGSQLTGVIATATGIVVSSGSNVEIVTQLNLTGSNLVLNVVNQTGSISVETAYESKGLFRTYPTLTDLENEPTNYFSDNQIVYIIDTNSLYKSQITYADFVSTFTDTIVWDPFVFEAGASAVANGDGLYKTYSSGITTLGLDTGSIHFTSAVEKIISSGSYMIDAGVI